VLQAPTVGTVACPESISSGKDSRQAGMTNPALMLLFFVVAYKNYLKYYIIHAVISYY
jgi:hypothetical protein